MRALPAREMVVVIPGLNGHPGMLLAEAPTLFPDWDAVGFDHHQDLAPDGVVGMAERAVDFIGDARPVWLCGESFGGTVALTVAHLAPERVKGLILFSTFGWHPSTLARRGVSALAVWSYLGVRVGDRAYRAARMASVASQFGPRFSQQLLREYLDRPRANVDGYRRKAELSVTFDARPWLPTIDQPAFILTGTFDPVVPISAGRELARLLPNASLHSLPGGHLAHLVNAPDVGRLISRWAASLADS